jgi:hypothetical protein
VRIPFHGKRVSEEKTMALNTRAKTKNIVDGLIFSAVLAALTVSAAAATQHAAAAPANLSPGVSVKFRQIAQLPSTATSSTASVANAVTITKPPPLPASAGGSAYNSWLTVADSRGRVYLVNAASYSVGVTNPNRTIVDLRTATQGLDVGNIIAGNAELGLRWFTYHPDFARSGTKGYLKAYSMSCHAVSTRTLTGAVTLNHNVPPGAPTRCDNVLMEWTIDPSTMRASSPRQILRWPQLHTNHATDALVFDQVTKLLYIAAGDGGSQGDPFDVAQDANYLYGKVLRIDPTKPGTTLPSNMARAAEGTFSYPTDNPYAAPGDPGRDPIYAIGFRHPETMIKDQSDLFVFDIGGSAFEEVNVLKVDGDEGKNFGWDIVEGRSPTNTSTVPPLAGYPHVNGNRAIMGGVAPESGPFAGKLILGDIPTGNIFYGDRAALKMARSWSTPMVPLQQFVMHNAGGTPRTLMAAFGRNSRVDLRLTEIDSGRVIGVSKQKGIVFEIFPL